MGRTLKQKGKGNCLLPTYPLSRRKRFREFKITPELVETLQKEVKKSPGFMGRIRREVRKLGQRLKERKKNVRPPKVPPREKLFVERVRESNPDLLKELYATE